MPKEREAIVIDNPVVQKITGAEDSVLAEIAAEAPSIPENETKEERKARIINVLSRSLVNDVLNVPLPDNLHGEWVRADPMQVRAMQLLGFKLDTEYAHKRAIHGDGSSGARIADVVFMITEKSNYETIMEVREEKRKQSEYRGLRAETEFARGVNRATDGDIGTFNESKVTKGMIPLGDIANQTSPQSQ
jgi:hypothetical protein